jgi:hypothetical protein
VVCRAPSIHAARSPATKQRVFGTLVWVPAPHQRSEPFGKEAHQRAHRAGCLPMVLGRALRIKRLQRGMAHPRQLTSRLEIGVTGLRRPGHNELLPQAHLTLPTMWPYFARACSFEPLFIRPSETTAESIRDASSMQ